MIKNKLLIKLLKHPDEFEKNGDSINLLQNYFEGFSIFTLKPLLKNSNYIVRETAIWILSELSDKAYPLISNVIKLLEENDRRLTYGILEIIMCNSSSEDSIYFIHIVNNLYNQDFIIKKLSMFLLSNANDYQLRSCIKHKNLIKQSVFENIRGIKKILEVENSNENDILSMLKEDNILKIYAAICASKTIGKFPNLIKEGIKSNNSLISRFCTERLEMYNYKLSLDI